MKLNGYQPNPPAPQVVKASKWLKRRNLGTRYGKVPCKYNYARMWAYSIVYHLCEIGYHIRRLWPRLNCGCWVECSGHEALEIYSRSAIENLTATQVVELQRQAQQAQDRFYKDPQKELARQVDRIIMKKMLEDLNMNPGKIMELDDLDDYDKLELNKEDMN